MCRKAYSSDTSYRIFRQPQITSGSPENGFVISAPANAGLNADARLRGTAVNPAAAARSGGVTTAITYEVRVGTSICDSMDRTSSRPSVIARLGEKAARVKPMLDGMWVN